MAKKWTDRLGELRKRLVDLIRDLGHSIPPGGLRPSSNSTPEPALVPVRARADRP